MNIDDEIAEQIRDMVHADARERIQKILQEKATAAWAKVCDWEGKKPTDPFVLVSPDNPHRGTLDEIIRTAQEMSVRISVHP
jgi:hypothetical protein